MVKKASQYIKGVLRKPKASIFLMFLVISFFIWFLITLSDTYVSHVNFKLKYSGIPEEKLVLGNPKTNLRLNIQASGFKILNYRLFKRDLLLPFSHFKENGDSYYMLAADVEESINDQYRSVLIRRIELDSLFLRLGENKQKQVPIVTKVQFSFDKDYQVKDSVKIIPDSVWVRGPEDLVKKITYVETVDKSYKNIHDDINYNIPLMIPDSIKKVQFEVQTATLSAEVERYSEKIVLVPVEITNLPDNMSIKLYPEKVKLLCKSPISELKNISPERFKVESDYRQINDETNFLIPQITEKPKFVSSVKLLDQKVEFLIKRQ